MHRVSVFFSCGDSSPQIESVPGLPFMVGFGPYNLFGLAIFVVMTQNGQHRALEIRSEGLVNVPVARRLLNMEALETIYCIHELAPDGETPKCGLFCGGSCQW